VECWKKEFKVEENMLVPLLRYVSVDTFETPCFVVEDKHGLHQEMRNDVRKMNSQKVGERNFF